MDANKACGSGMCPVQCAAMNTPLSDCRRLVLATTNAHKLRELRMLLAPLGVPLIGLAELGRQVSAVPEAGDSLREISRAKASGYARQLGEWVLSDDTGLEVAALGGAPGVRTARYASDSATMAENRVKLLADLEHCGPDERSARFVCCLSLAAPDGEIILEATGVCPGRIRTEPSGSGGFGYDLLFEVDVRGRTLAELDDVSTAEVGHRGRAARELLAIAIEPRGSTPWLIASSASQTTRIASLPCDTPPGCASV